MRREIKYSEVMDSLKTGDLVFFHGKQSTSILIEFIEWSYWSHVGMVVLPKDIGLEGDEPLFFESTASGDGIEDVLIHAVRESGPMLVPLSQRIHVDVSEDFDNHFTVRYSNLRYSEESLKTLKELIVEAHKWRFPTTTEALKYYEEGRHKNVDGPEDICFCSQLVARIFVALGYMSGDYVSNGYCPNDFIEMKNMPLIQQVFFTEGANLNG